MTPDEAMALAKEHTSRGNTAAAIGIYQSILATSPQHKKAKKALNALQRSESAGSPDALQTDMSSVMALYNTGKLDQALTQIKRLCKIHKDQPMPLNVMGVILSAKGLHKEAIDCFTQALNLSPEYLDPLNNLGSALDVLQRHDEAIVTFEKLLQLDPNYNDAHYNLGNALVNKGEYQQAVHHYELAIEQRPAVPRNHIRLGLTLAALGQFNAAMASLQNALSLEPGRVDAHEYMGDILVSQQMLSSALTWYEDTAKLAPNHAQVHFKLGAVLRDLDRPQDAKDALKRCLTLNPQYPRAQALLDSIEA